MRAYPISRSTIAIASLTGMALFLAPAAHAVQPAAETRLAQYQVLEVSPSAAGDGEVSGDRTGRNVQTRPDDGQEERVAEMPYLWTITVSEEGFRFGGNVPADSFRRFLAVRAQAISSDESTIRPGAPDGFVTDALAALEAARLLAKGRAGLDEAGWFVEGALEDAQSRDQLDTILAAAATDPSEWRLAINKPVPDIDDVGNEETKPVFDRSVESAETRVEQSVTETDEGNESVGPGVESAQSDEDIVSPDAMDQVELDEDEVDRAAIPAEPAPDYNFAAVKIDGDTIVLRGFAPGSFLQQILATDGLAVEINQITTRSEAPEGFVQAAYAGLQALAKLETGQIMFRDGAWLLSGTAEIDTISNAAIASLSVGSPDTDWKTLVRAPLALDICREAVTAYMADRAILFPSAGTAPTQASMEVLPGLAERLSICPDAPLYVEGHTDSDGGDDANLMLSIRRAEAVVDALVDLGIDPSRLFAVGYGASLPVAPNTTTDGKRQNRRIVFSFEDIAQPQP